MILESSSIKWISSAWEVLVLFLIPVGGGIPAGVLLAKTRGFAWPMMLLLYFISDVILACLFEPVMKLIIAAGKRIQFLGRWIESVKQITSKSTSKYGLNHGPISLVAISFGVDPMTGRSVAQAAGHSFVSGWALAISGDMIFFTILMVSTLWLDKVLGDGTWTAIIIMAAMMIIPAAIRRLRQWWNPKQQL